MTTQATHPIGTISHGTMREEDLIPRFLHALRQLDPTKAAELQEEWEEIKLSTHASHQGEALSDFCWGDLCNALDVRCMPYFYFGSHPGDGSDYGFWLSEDLQQQVEYCGGLVVGDTSKVPGDYSGEVLHVNDHGNATLYTATNGTLTEVWAVV